MQAMSDGDIQVLVCTTIIETGLDIPNANTLIIENADRFGLSQLHQLRGRVGRSTRHAFAYFTYQPSKNLTEIAEKNNVPTHIFSQLQKYYSSVPVYTDHDVVMSLFNAFGEILWGSTDNFTYKTINMTYHNQSFPKVVKNLDSKTEERVSDYRRYINDEKAENDALLDKTRLKFSQRNNKNESLRRRKNGKRFI
jgi:superfamily II DNA or RNA helicase